MKFTCLQENLKQGLNVVSHIASKNTSLPILNNVLIQAEEGLVKLVATNLEVGISCIVRGKIEKKGAYTINSKLINDYVNLLPNETVAVKLEDDFLKISCLNYETKIKGNSSEEFPLIPEIKKDKGYRCKSDDLLKALTQTGFAAAVDTKFPEISGLYFNFSGDSLTIAATDRNRLAEKVIKLTEKTVVDKALIVPGRTINELVRILGSIKRTKEEEVTAPDAQNKEEDLVSIYFEDNQILFSFDTIEMVSRIIEGQYPDYKAIIPADYKTRAVLNIAELAQAFKTASLFARDFGVILEFKDNKVIVTAANNQLGDNRVEVATVIEGEKNAVKINYRYLLDGLGNIDATDVIFQMINKDSPCILRPAESLEGNAPISLEDYLYIIMPMKMDSTEIKG